LAVWTDGRNVGGSIYGTRVSTSGAVLDPAGIAISVAQASPTSPAVVWDGTHHLVAWTDLRTDLFNPAIWGGRVGTNGATLDGSGVQLVQRTDGVKAP